MITGETEHIIQQGSLEDGYDAFFGSRKKRRARRARRAKRTTKRVKRRSEPVRVKRRAKRTRFFKNIGQIYRDVGGATTIGAAIDAITTPKPIEGYGTSASSNQSDFTIDMGTSKDIEKENKGIPVVFYVLGGVIVLGVIGIAVISRRTNKQNQQY